MEKIRLPIRVKHFLGSDYDNPTICPIANSAKDFFNVGFAAEGVDSLTIVHMGIDTNFKHRKFLKSEYVDLKDSAEKLKDEPEATLLHLELTKCES